MSEPRLPRKRKSKDPVIFAQQCLDRLAAQGKTPESIAEMAFASAREVDARVAAAELTIRSRRARKSHAETAQQLALPSASASDFKASTATGAMEEDRAGSGEEGETKRTKTSSASEGNPGMSQRRLRLPRKRRPAELAMATQQALANLAAKGKTVDSIVEQAAAEVREMEARAAAGEPLVRSRRAKKSRAKMAQQLTLPSASASSSKAPGASGAAGDDRVGTGEGREAKRTKPSSAPRWQTSPNEHAAQASSGTITDSVASPGAVNDSITKHKPEKDVKRDL